MKISEEIRNGVKICKVEGEVNIETSPQLRKVFEDFIKNNIKKIAIDFGLVSYIDSSGLATLIELSQRLKKIDGKFRLFALSEKVKNVFEVTKLFRVFEIFDTQEQALNEF
jgi:anti-sigma B factor antagonist